MMKFHPRAWLSWRPAMAARTESAMTDPIPLRSKFLEAVPDGAFKILAVGLALLIGLAVRIPYIFATDTFPLGDGGLFIAMINAIKANHYLLPATVHYNGFEIPFAYPPLGFYAVIIFSRLFGLPTLLAVRFLPLAFNFLTIVFFVLLAAEVLKDRKEVLFSSILFPVVFQVYQWTIRGGGITRSPGFFFFVATVYFVHLYLKRLKPAYLAVAVPCLSATVMSHLEWGLITVASIVLFLLVNDFRNWKRNAQVLIILGLGSLILTSPWWGTVISKNGIRPFLMAAQVASMEPGEFFEKLLSGGLFAVTVTVSKNYFLPWLGMIGVVISLLKKNWLLPGWLIATYIAAPKNAPISGIVPLVLLVAFALHSLDQYLVQLVHAIRLGQNAALTFLRRLVSLVPLSSVYLLVILSAVWFSLAGTPLVRPIKQSERAAIQFAAEHTPPDARFVVITPSGWYGADAAEWFPFLADRQSLTTPQGLEWVSATQFNRIAESTFYLSTLVRDEQSGMRSGEMVQYVEGEFEQFDYVAILAGDVELDFGGFMATERYEVIYAKKDALILARKPLEQ